MLFKNIYGYSILGFKQEQLEDLYMKILESDLFLSTTTPNRTDVLVNTGYEEYLSYKNAVYTENNVEVSEDSVSNMTILPDHLSMNYYNYIKDKINLEDDFVLNTEIQSIDRHAYLKIHRVKLYEQELMDCSIEMGEIYDKVDRDFLSGNFIVNKQLRIMLLPPKIKDKGNYLINYIMLTIYEEGFITLNLCVQECLSKKLKLYDNIPRDHSFEEVSFYNFAEKQGIEAYQSLIIKNGLTMDDIINYYKSQILEEVKIDFFEMQDFNFLSWGIADFTPFKSPYNTYSDFKNRYKEHIIQMLTNCNRLLLEKFHTDNEKNILEESNVYSAGSLEYFCRDVFSIFTMRSEKILNLVEDSLVSLKKESTYQNMLRQELSKQVFFSGVEFVRFFEIAYIKIYFLKYVIKSLDYNKDFSVAQYSDFLFKMNNIKFQYSSEVLFNNSGSPKKMYEKILENTGANILEKQTEDFLKGFKDEVYSRNDQKKVANDTLLLILTSVITVIISFGGLNNIFKIILGENNENLLLYTILVWMPLFLILLILNIRKWFLK